MAAAAAAKKKTEEEAVQAKDAAAEIERIRYNRDSVKTISGHENDPFLFSKEIP